VAAVRQAQRLCRLQPASVYVCWDLDNTLVGSGVILRAGKRLEDAIVEAKPVANMLEFYGAIHVNVREAHHFILSARTRSMRRETVAWLHRHGLPPADGALCFVPAADAKPRVWEQLARNGTLVIVDDLSYNHETDETNIYAELVQVAERVACVYIGLDEINRIGDDARAIDSIVEDTLETLSRCTAPAMS